MSRAILRQQPLRLLLVEDSPGDAELVHRALRDVGRRDDRVTRAPRLVDAEEHLAAGATDLVLLDLGLPDARGLEALDAVRRAAPDVPVVVLSGHDDDALALAAVQRGAQDFLRKGELDPPRLSRAIRYAIERRRQLAEIEALNVELGCQNARLRTESRVDPLTGLLNRRGLEADLMRLASLAQRAAVPLTAVLVDCDDFKNVNERFGHAVGDLALKDLAGALLASLRPSDTVARIGGDEFLMVLAETGVEDGAGVAERTRVKVAGVRRTIDGVPIGVTASFAVTRVDPRAVDLSSILASTRGALASCKHGGKNRVVIAGAEPRVWREELDGADRRELLAALRGTNGIHTVAQPIFDLASRRVLGQELLTRGPSGPYESPGALFAVAAHENLRTSLDIKCLRTSLRAAQAFAEPMRLHVNLCTETLCETSISRVLEPIVESLARPQRVCIELDVTERVRDLKRLDAVTRTLRDAGVQLALDHVGAGFSPLEELAALRPTYVKLDPSCVRGIGSDTERAEQLAALVDISRAVGAEPMASGIEREHDLERLTALGVACGQGFLLAEPSSIPSPALGELMQTPNDRFFGDASTVSTH